MHKVSVIIPVYNVEKYLRECLESVVNQTLKEIEIICVNDGSTDKSLDILLEFQRKDNRIVVYSQENKGQSAARNFGLQNASGEYVYFLDSDDKLEIRALELLYLYAHKDALDILLFNASVFYETERLARKFSNYQTYYNRVNSYIGIYRGIDMFVAMQLKNEFRASPCLQLLRTNFLKQNKIYFYEGIIYEDNLFSFICLMKAEKVGYIKENLFLRRIREGSTITKRKTAVNVIGYYTCYIQMLEFCMYYKITEPIVKEYLNSILNNTKDIYMRLNDIERRKIVFAEDSWEGFLFETQIKVGFSKLDKIKWIGNKIIKKISTKKVNHIGLQEIIHER